MKGYNRHNPLRAVMTWSDDPDVWETMDSLLLDVWINLKEFLDTLSQYRDEINPMLWTLLAPGLGGLTKAYNEARMESNPPQIALALALERTVKHGSIQRLMMDTMNQSVDKVVEGME